MSADWKRVRSAFESEPVWSYHSLLHRLGESAAERLEPRRFRKALARALARARGFIAEPLPRIYVHRGSERTVLNDATNCVVQLGRLREKLHPDPTTSLLRSVLGRVEAADHSGQSVATWRHERRIGGELSVQAVDRWWAGRLAGRHYTIWINHDLRWVELHDVRLWRFIEACWQEESAGLIVARKIEPAVFSLLKGLGIRGLQFHAFQVKEGLAVEAEQIRSNLRWVRTQGIENFPNHAVLEHVVPMIWQTLPLIQDSKAGAAAADAITRGFAGTRAPKIAALLDWWTGSGIAVVEKTLASLRHGLPTTTAEPPDRPEVLVARDRACGTTARGKPGSLAGRRPSS